MKRKLRISVAIPDSSLSDETHLREKTLKLSRFARAFSIFGVDKVYIYRDPTEKENKYDANLLSLILEYLNSPPYLRKLLYPINNKLVFAGLLPPIKSPHHKKKVKLNEIKVGEKRVGVIRSIGDERRYESGQERNRKIKSYPILPRFLNLKSERTNFYVDIGLDLLIPFYGNCIDGEKLYVKIVKSYPNIRAVRSSENDLKDQYWGYSIENIQSLQNFLIRLDKRSFVILTSKQGKFFIDEKVRFQDFLKHSENLIVVFGSPKRGISEIFNNILNVKQEILYVNMFPYQNTETVRLEEAILGALSIINYLL